MLVHKTIGNQCLHQHPWAWNERAPKGPWVSLNPHKRGVYNDHDLRLGQKLPAQIAMAAAVRWHGNTNVFLQFKALTSHFNKINMVIIDQQAFATTPEEMSTPPCNPVPPITALNPRRRGKQHVQGGHHLATAAGYTTLCTVYTVHCVSFTKPPLLQRNRGGLVNAAYSVYHCSWPKAGLAAGQSLFQKLKTKAFKHL